MAASWPRPAPCWWLRGVVGVVGVLCPSVLPASLALSVYHTAPCMVCHRQLPLQSTAGTWVWVFAGRLLGAG